jgi:hypothetical protein
MTSFYLIFILQIILWEYWRLVSVIVFLQMDDEWTVLSGQYQLSTGFWN